MVCFCLGIICVEGMNGGAVHIDYNCVPSVIYTHPVSTIVPQGGRESLKKWLKGLNGQFL